MSALQNFPRVTPFLWFDSNAEEAVDFYLAVFQNSRRLDEVRTGDDSRGPKGSILTIAFEPDGQTFTALNGGPMFKFTEAVSFVPFQSGPRHGGPFRHLGRTGFGLEGAYGRDDVAPRPCPVSTMYLAARR